MKQIPIYKKIIHFFGNIFKFFFWIAFFVGLVAAGLIAFYFFSFASSTPTVSLSKIQNPPVSSLYDVNGTKIKDIGEATRYKDVTYEELPENLINAVVAIEDRKFFAHDGYDAARIAGSAVGNVSSSGSISSGAGGSTITQQLIKNTQGLRTKALDEMTFTQKLDMKIQEAVMANELEKQMSKQDILAAYLNNNHYYGDSVLGIRAAAKYYFDKDVSQLTLPESAFLAGVPQSPSYYNPYAPFPGETEEQQKVNNALPFERYRMVLQAMVDSGFITQAEYDEAVKIPLAHLMRNGLTTNDSGINAYITAATKEARQKLQLEENESIPAGTKIYINVNQDLQRFGNDVQENIQNHSSYGIPYPGDDYQMGYAVIENKTGRIVAIGAGRGNNNSLTNFNFATQEKRQPGSTIKPIIDYAPAIEKFKWSSAKMMNDSKINFIYSTTPVVNYDSSYKGTMTMTQAIADSRNVTAVLSYREVNKDTTTTPNYSADFLRKIGINLEYDEMFEPYAIGGFTYGTTAVEMAGAYSAFGNNGKFATPNFVSKITDSDDKIIYQWNEATDSKQAMSEETASIMTTALIYSMQGGLANENSIPGLTLAGKTGTADRGDGVQNNQWFVGYSPDYTISVWGGFMDQTKAVSHNYSRWYVGAVFKALMAKIANPSSQFVYSPRTYQNGIYRYWSEGNYDGGVLGPNGNTTATKVTTTDQNGNTTNTNGTGTNTNTNTDNTNTNTNTNTNSNGENTSTQSFGG